MKHRPERLSSLIQEELNKIISKEVEFSDCLVTITGVEIDEKISRAVVKFSVLSFCGSCPFKCGEGGAPEKIDEQVLKTLNKKRDHIQYLLMKKINVKSMPQISFKLDYGPEKAAEIEKILLDDKMNKKG